MAQRRRTREQWRELVTGWHGSGLTQQAYCERHGVSAGSLQRWREVFRREREAGAEPTPDARFLPIAWADVTPARVAPLVVVFANGRRLEIAPDFDAPTLTRLLLALEAA